MKITVTALVLLAAGTTAFASVDVQPHQIVDVAAIPAYAPDSPVKDVVRMHHRRHASRRHHREHVARHRHREREHVAKHHRHEEEKHAPEMKHVVAAPISPIISSATSRALALGAIIGVPEGWADGMATEIGNSDRAYLIAHSEPGYTMERQGVGVAIGRLHPTFVQRLAAAFREAYAGGLAPCVFSAYRPPGFGVGGFHDKYRSAHSYGLAVDLCGLDGPGSHDAIVFRRIAARHGVYGPYSVYSSSEYNHFEPTKSRDVTDEAPALRHTITSDGPPDLNKMWKVADAILDPAGEAPLIGERHAARHRRHYAEHRHRHRHTRLASG